MVSRFKYFNVELIFFTTFVYLFVLCVFCVVGMCVCMCIRVCYAMVSLQDQGTTWWELGSPSSM